MKELVSKKYLTHIPGHHLYHSYFLTQQKNPYLYVDVQSTPRKNYVFVFFFFLLQKKMILFHFFSGALWCVTWWRRKYHLFFTVLLHLSHRTSPPIVCIFKICYKKENMNDNNISTLDFFTKVNKQLILFRKKVKKFTQHCCLSLCMAYMSINVS